MGSARLSDLPTQSTRVSSLTRKVSLSPQEGPGSVLSLVSCPCCSVGGRGWGGPRAVHTWTSSLLGGTEGVSHSPHSPPAL